MRVLDHCAQLMAEPALVELEPGRFVVRFETMKVASARAAVNKLLRDGVVQPGGTVIDSSSGLYALALALACHEVGLHAIIVGSTTIDAGVQAQLELLGARLEQMPPTTSLALDQDRRVARVRQIVEREPGIHWMRQYHDPIHDDGYVPIGERVGRELAGRGFARARLVAPVGSGVSGFAVSGGMNSALPTSLVGVQPFGSVTFGAAHVEDPEIIIAGIGSSIPFGNVRHEAYDVVHWVSHDVACSATVALLRRHALFAGLSSGAAWAVATYEAGTDPEVDPDVEAGPDLRAHCGASAPPPAGGRTATVWVAPDTGHRYVPAVHARHERFAPMESFTPQTVATTDELVKPWSRLEWNGRPAPAQARLPAGR